MSYGVDHQDEYDMELRMEEDIRDEYCRGPGQLDEDNVMVNALDRENIFWKKRLDEYTEERGTILREQEFEEVRALEEKRIKEQKRIHDESRVQKELRQRELYEAQQEQEWEQMDEDMRQAEIRIEAPLSGDEAWDEMSSENEPEAGSESWPRERKPKLEESKVAFVLSVFEPYIRNYSSRQLTYSSDALAAILSILQLFSSAVAEFRTYYGVPFYYGTPQSKPRLPLCPNRTYVLNLATGLCWSHGNRDLKAIKEFPQILGEMRRDDDDAVDLNS
ncbi:hypothetical protein P152DRAFT_477195 [Eremomyces bilateralis CBS 781.70]|uniref:Uncharacterized protein n=1 Tax=Eremomyces bilateralis CBS 781.70 TaxID=1392243 RepID=A0A6G1FS77_9PEZI|nr:uncharacterized protein P152DRAFT_477195 [Eremomyces bilateralis CBS 781.70]KAF1808522.1 hypothetical protein P152DRAFT_477195 [Eremomyces bilateralis CBS 781.70]